jgi:membrane-bound lytic murein transglycosylase D
MTTVKAYLFSAIALVFANSTTAQTDTSHYTLAPDDPVVAMIDSLMQKDHIKRDGFVFKAEKVNKYNFPADYIPEVRDSIYKQRIDAMNERTPFEYAFNDDVLAYIKLYAEKRRSFTSIAMGRAAMYFPLFEEKLAKYDMPLELKYLSVVESALNPTAKSPAGAMGLWQFMLTTGKMYGLDVDSYLDERRDPIKATEAACQLLKSLYSYYNDWSMALAAYNAGPGTVNRAIRRSGGKMTYWEIRPFLPKETQGYVPAFIAVNYAFTYAAEHNIMPRVATKAYYDVDTVHISESLKFSQLAALLDIPADLLMELNPLYKTDHIPKLDEQQYLYLPINKIGDFMANEDSLYKWNRSPQSADAFISYSSSAVHTVGRGEYLSLIANKYKCSVDELMAWNDLKTTNLYVGQKLSIRTTTHVPVEKDASAGGTVAATNQSTQSSTNTSGNTSTTTAPAQSYYYYTIQSGDTLWHIAQKKGISLTTLKQLNKGLNERDLKVGSKIKIGVKG